MSILEKFGLAGQVVIVTGAGKGIGAGIARTFAEAGADVVVGARTEADLQRVAQDVEAMGRRALVVPTDVLDFAQLQHIVDRAMAEFSRIDILTEFITGLGGRAKMGRAMTAQLVPLITNTFNQCRVALCYPSQGKKGRLGIMLSK